MMKLLPALALALLASPVYSKEFTWSEQTQYQMAPDLVFISETKDLDIDKVRNVIRFTGVFLLDKGRGQFDPIYPYFDARKSHITFSSRRREKPLQMGFKCDSSRRFTYSGSMVKSGTLTGLRNYLCEKHVGFVDGAPGRDDAMLPDDSFDIDPTPTPEPEAKSTRIDLDYGGAGVYLDTKESIVSTGKDIFGRKLVKVKWMYDTNEYQRVKGTNELARVGTKYCVKYYPNYSGRCEMLTGYKGSKNDAYYTGWTCPANNFRNIIKADVVVDGRKFYFPKEVRQKMCEAAYS